MNRDTASKELLKKLDPSAVKPAKDYGPKGDYIEGWHAIAEANRIFGFFDWSYTIVAVQCVAQEARKIGKGQKDGWGVTYTAHVRVLVDGVTREDFGAGHGYDVDLGLAHESAVKEATTDALKRALRTFGNPFGLALYDKTRENVGHNAPDATPQEVEAALDSLKGVTSLPDLQTYWANLYRKARHVADHPEVYAMKETMKTQLAQKDAA